MLFETMCLCYFVHLLCMYIRISFEWYYIQFADYNLFFVLVNVSFLQLSLKIPAKPIKSCYLAVNSYNKEFPTTNYISTEKVASLIITFHCQK